LSNEVAHISTDLGEVLAYFREDLGGGPRRTRSPQRGEFSPTHSSSSQDDDHPRREWRPPRQPLDDLRDMKIDPPDFEGSLNPYLYIEWIQALEIYFEIKEYSDEKAFQMAILKLKKYASLWYENTERQ